MSDLYFVTLTDEATAAELDTTPATPADKETPAVTTPEKKAAPAPAPADEVKVLLDSIAAAVVAEQAVKKASGEFAAAVAVSDAVRGEYCKAIAASVAGGTSMAALSRTIGAVSTLPSYVQKGQASIKRDLVVGRVLGFKDSLLLGKSTLTIEGAFNAAAEGEDRTVTHVATVVSQHNQPTLAECKEFGIRPAAQVLDDLAVANADATAAEAAEALEAEVRAFAKAKAEAEKKAAAEKAAEEKAAAEAEAGPQGKWAKGLKGLPKESLFESLLTALTDGATPSSEDIALIDAVLANMAHLVATAKAATPAV